MSVPKECPDCGRHRAAAMVLGFACEHERCPLVSFTCPRCGLTSHNLNDIVEGYCGNCHDWTGAT